MDTAENTRSHQQEIVVISLEDQARAIAVAKDNCLHRIVTSHQDSVRSAGNFCSPAWDGLMCWPPTRAGETAELRCAWYVNNFYLHASATRTCTDTGHWFVHSEINNTWTNYSNCRKPDLFIPEVPHVPVAKEHVERIKLMYSTGYGVSLVALAIAIFIMVYFRRLHCPRNTIHLNLFTSFVLRALLSFLKDSLMVTHLGLPGDVLEVSPGYFIFDTHGTSLIFLHENVLLLNASGDVWWQHWQCKLLFTTFHYVQLASSAWVFVEGLYLYILVTVTIFSERRYIRWCTVMGWGGPLFFLAPWVTLRATVEDEFCWNTHPTQGFFWILKAPQMVIAVVNFIFFLNIVRVLFTKLVRCGPPRARRYRYRRLGKSTLVLIPIFGVHYLVTIAFPENIDPLLETVKLYFEMFFNSFQGLLIACLFCFMNGEVQTEIRKRYIRYRLRVNSRNYQNKYLVTATSQMRARTAPSYPPRPESREQISSSGSDHKLCTEKQRVRMYVHPSYHYRAHQHMAISNDVRPIIFTSNHNSYV